MVCVAPEVPGQLGLGHALIATEVTLELLGVSVFVHAVDLQANLLGEGLATLFTQVITLPGWDPQVDMLVMLLHLKLSGEDQLAPGAPEDAPQPAAVVLHATFAPLLATSVLLSLQRTVLGCIKVRFGFCS